MYSTFIILFHPLINTGEKEKEEEDEMNESNQSEILYR